MSARRHSNRVPFCMLALISMATAATAPAGQKEKKEILIKTSGGYVKASADPDPAHLGLPLYPGAKLLKNDQAGGLEFNLAVPGKPPVRFVVAKFFSSDSVPKILDFYKKHLGKDVTKFTPKDDEGSSVFELKQKSLQRYVSLKSVEGGTQIDLVRIEGADDDSK